MQTQYSINDITIQMMGKSPEPHFNLRPHFSIFNEDSDLTLILQSVMEWASDVVFIREYIHFAMQYMAKALAQAPNAGFLQVGGSSNGFPSRLLPSTWET